MNGELVTISLSIFPRWFAEPFFQYRAQIFYFLFFGGKEI